MIIHDHMFNPRDVKFAYIEGDRELRVKLHGSDYAIPVRCTNRQEALAALDELHREVKEAIR